MIDNPLTEKESNKSARSFWWWVTVISVILLGVVIFGQQILPKQAGVAIFAGEDLSQIQSLTLQEVERVGGVDPVFKFRVQYKDGDAGYFLIQTLSKSKTSIINQVLNVFIEADRKDLIGDDLRKRVEEELEKMPVSINDDNSTSPAPPPATSQEYINNPADAINYTAQIRSNDDTSATAFPIMEKNGQVCFLTNTHAVVGKENFKKPNVKDVVFPNSTNNKQIIIPIDSDKIFYHPEAVEINDGKPLGVGLVKGKFMLDWAVFVGEVPENFPMKIFKVSDRPIYKGQAVASVGYGIDNAGNYPNIPAIEELKVTNPLCLECGVTHTFGGVTAGDSGAPLIVADRKSGHYEVVGMIAGAIEEEGFCIPTDQIQRALKKCEELLAEGESKKIGDDDALSRKNIAKDINDVSLATGRLKTWSSNPNLYNYGTGVIVGSIADENKRRLFILTNRHNIQNDRNGIFQLNINNTPPQSFPIKIIRTSQGKADLAVLAIDVPLSLNVPVVSVSSKMPQRGQEVFTIGCPSGVFPPVTGSCLVDATTVEIGSSGARPIDSFVFNKQFLSGSSGGPIINDNKQLVSLISGRDERFGIGETTEEIIDLLQTVEKELNLENERSPFIIND